MYLFLSNNIVSYSILILYFSSNFAISLSLIDSFNVKILSGRFDLDRYTLATYSTTYNNSSRKCSANLSGSTTIIIS